MNRTIFSIVCLFLLLNTQKGIGQENEKLTCEVKSATYKIRQENGGWSDWRPYNTGNEKKQVNIIFDFSKMNMFWVSQQTAVDKTIDPGIAMYKIIQVVQDTAYKQFGFYNIKLKCNDAKGMEMDYELLSLNSQSCHSLMLVSTDDKFITKRELEIVR